MVEYRPVPADRLPDFRRLIDYGFRLSEGPRTHDPNDDLPGPATVGDRRGLFDEESGELLSVGVHHWFTARIRNDWHSVAGLTGIASPPEYRRQGLVERFLVESLRECRDRGCSLAALWPFKYAFYRRYGWAIGGKYALFECPPDALSFADENPMGEFRRLTADEYELLDPVLEAHSQRFSLAVRRTEAWWRHRVFEGWETDPYVYAWVDDVGDVCGYLVYAVDDAGDRSILRVTDLAYADHGAYRQLLRFLYYHDGQVDRIRIYGPPDSFLLDFVGDPRSVECTIRPGPMIRTVDVETALESLTSSNDVAGCLVLAVTDSLVDWNADTFQLDVSDGTVTCHRVADVESDVSMDIATLSQLHVGYLSIERAQLAGRLSIETDGARDLLADLFPPQDVFLRDGF